MNNKALNQLLTNRLVKHIRSAKKSNRLEAIIVMSRAGESLLSQLDAAAGCSLLVEEDYFGEVPHYAVTLPARFKREPAKRSNRRAPRYVRNLVAGDDFTYRACLYSVLNIRRKGNDCIITCESTVTLTLPRDLVVIGYLNSTSVEAAANA